VDQTSTLCSDSKMKLLSSSWCRAMVPSKHFTVNRRFQPRKRPKS